MKPRNLPTIEPTRDDILRLAAYIDGEGSIELKRFRSPRPNGWGIQYALEVKVYNSDVRLPAWCQKRFGGSVSLCGRANRLRKQDMFTWRITCKQARAILVQCLNFFIIKREQAEVAIEFCDTITRSHAGRALPEKVIADRESLRNKIMLMKKPYKASA